MSKWTALKHHYLHVANRAIMTLFQQNPSRAEEFSLQRNGLFFDFSKTNIDETALELLLKLAADTNVEGKRQAMFSGVKINDTEGRAVLHTALRGDLDAQIVVDDRDIMPDVRLGLDRMLAFARNVRDGHITGEGGRFTDVVNIGIGGSDLGPAMASIALQPYATGPRVHFVSNVDSAHIRDVLGPLDPKTTLIIVASKTFTTAETMTNAHAARAWLAQAVTDTGSHFAAVSTALARTTAYGIAPERVFGFEDWVGGRYSVWGPVGLALLLSIGEENFLSFLAGGRAMDQHFQTAPLAENMPVLLGLVGVWHNQICDYACRVVLPYEQRLARLPAYLQQLEMESNGKSVAQDGGALEVPSGPVVWGEPGTNGQHAFFQLLHQGSRIVPCEFLVAKRGHEPELAHQHLMLAANCLAQSEALLVGRSYAQALEQIKDMGFPPNELHRQARHRVFAGNRPSTTLVYDRLDPYTLGQIVALYEHRVFVEGVVLGINSFDQWGVELGKELAQNLLPILEGRTSAADKDGSTRQLLALFAD